MQPWQRPEILTYSRYLAESFRHWTGKNLSLPDTPEALYHAPFVAVSHGIENDPIFCYANLSAQTLWKMQWEKFVSIPSRFSAEADERNERERLLKIVQTKGYIDDYSGVRVTADGKRFKIEHCVVWNVLDDRREKIGQAATFSHWTWL